MIASADLSIVWRTAGEMSTKLGLAPEDD
jgi:hypothetical protein